MVISISLYAMERIMLIFQWLRAIWKHKNFELERIKPSWKISLAEQEESIKDKILE